MGKGRTTALLIAVAIVAIGVVRTAGASHDAGHIAFSGGPTFKGLVIKTSEDPAEITVSAPNWQVVDSRGFSIPAGESQLVSVDFFARTFCEGSGECAVRAVIGRTLASAIVMAPGAADIDIGGTDSTEGHAVSLASCVRNATGSPLNVSVWFQAQLDDGDPTFSLGRWTFKIARHAPCTPTTDI